MPPTTTQTNWSDTAWCMYQIMEGKSSLSTLEVEKSRFEKSNLKFQITPVTWQLTYWIFVSGCSSCESWRALQFDSKGYWQRWQKQSRNYGGKQMHLWKVSWSQKLWFVQVRVTRGPNLRGPVFEQFLYEVPISEGAAKFSTLVTARAKDPEGGPVR